MSSSAAPIRPRRHAGLTALLAAAAAVAALVAAIWIVPGLLDWNRYRSSIESLVSAGLGRPVRIDGNIMLHLLPQPFLTATDLKLDDAGDGVVMQAHAVRLRIALGSLMAGRVDARELTIQGADLRLPWPPPAGALSRRPPTWITGLQARVEDSRLQIGDFALSAIDAALGADPDTGTLSAAGVATLFNLPARFTIRLGRPARDGAAPLTVSLDGQDRLRDTGGTISGAIEADGSLSGRIAARGPDLSQLLPAPATPWRAEGRVSAAGGVLVADELGLEIAGSPARGAVALRVQPNPRLDLALAASRLDLDAWLPVLLRGTPALARPAAPGRPATGETAIDMGIETGIDLSAEQATLAGGTLRQLRTALDIAATGVTVREATAIVPGDAKLSLRGAVPRRTKVFAFDGTGTLIAPDLHATLRWLEPLAPAIIRALPPGAFRTANLAAHIAADPNQLSFTDLGGTLDGGAVQGGVVIRLGTRPAVSFGLSLDRLLLDPFVPDPALLADPAAAYADAVRALSTAGFDSDLKLQVRQANWRGAGFGPLALDVQSEAGRLTVRRLEATVAGLHAAASGTLGEGGRLSEGRLELTAQDVAPLRPFVPPEAADLAALLSGPASLLLTAAGPPEALALRGSLEAGDLRIDVQPVLDIPGHRWAGSVLMHQPNAARLLGQLGVAGIGGWLGEGSFSLIAQLSRVPGRVGIGNVELVAGELRARGQLAIARRALQGRITAETLPLPAPDPRSPDPLPLAALQRFDAALHVEAERVLVGLRPTLTELAADLTIENGAVSVDNIRARHDAATLAGTVRVAPGDLPRVAVRAQLDNLAVTAPVLGSPLDLSSGTLSATATVAAEGYSPAALVATLTGNIDATLSKAEVTGFDLPAVVAAFADPIPATLLARLREASLGGTTSFASVALPIELKGGVATIKADGSVGPPPAPGAALTAAVDLVGRTAEGRLVLAPGAGAPDLSVRLSGPVTNLARTPELAGAARWLAERP